MSTASRSALCRRWGSAEQLGELMALIDEGLAFAQRDFSLLTIAGELSQRFPGQLVFKGGFVLRHVHGVSRLSTDVDATKHEPAKHKLDASEVAEAIRAASVGDIVRFSPRFPPSTDTSNSLDFDKVTVSGVSLPETEVQVEISYREEVVAPPRTVLVGPPFDAEFMLLAMAVTEMAAEKLRTLAQRTKATDLADIAELLVHAEAVDDEIGALAETKFKLVREGAVNRAVRIERNLLQMREDYDATVLPLFPGARSYADAMAIVWPRIRRLIPS